MDLIARLKRLDAKRASLDLYAQRVRMAGWIAPRTAEKFRRILHQRFEDASRERKRVLDLIYADPVMKERLRRNELKALTASRTLPPTSSPREIKASKSLSQQAVRVVEAERDEAARATDFAEALHYYGTGEWQRDGAISEHVDHLLDGLRVKMDRARLARGRLLDGLQTMLDMEIDRSQGPASLQMENLLSVTRSSIPHPPRQMSPLLEFKKWLAKELLPSDRER